MAEDVVQETLLRGWQHARELNRRLLVPESAGAAVAGTWTAGYDGAAEITGASAIPVSQLTALHIEAPSHRLLLSIPL